MNLLQLIKENNQKIYEEIRVKYVLNQLENLDLIEKIARFYTRGVKEAVKGVSSYQELFNKALNVYIALNSAVDRRYTFTNSSSCVLNYDQHNKEYNVEFDLVDRSSDISLPWENITFYIRNGKLSTYQEEFYHHVHWHGDSPILSPEDAIMEFGNERSKILRVLKLAEELEMMRQQEKIEVIYQSTKEEEEEHISYYAVKELEKTVIVARSDQKGTILSLEALIHDPNAFSEVWFPSLETFLDQTVFNQLKNEIADTLQTI